MHTTYYRRYTGPLRAVILDWAGTIVDYGSCAPVVAISRAYATFGIEVTAEECRGPMGTHKRDHVRRVGELPRVSALWRQVHGEEYGPEAVDKVFNTFLEIDAEIVAEHSVPIPGAIEAFEAFRARGMKIGTTTGYTRVVMERVEAEAGKCGLKADAVMAASDVPTGRPAPWMMFSLAQQLDVYPMEALVKVGDNVVDIDEGLNAGTWTVGLAKTGNLVGLKEAEIAAAGPENLRGQVEQAAETLRRAGAHYVVESIAECPALLDDIEARLARGERP